MSCVFCGGPVVSKRVSFIFDDEDQFIVIKNVPAEVCTHCGEKTYSPKTTDKILKFTKHRFKPVKTIKVPVFDYTEKH
jgi:YgiT-type zinc finger domain-containing protein